MRGVLALFDQGIEQRAVVRGDVLHIAQVLVPAFNLEAAHARVHQRRQIGALVVVLHGEHVFVVGHKAAFVINHLVGQAAGLAAFTPVGTASCVGVADIALAAVGNAQRAMHKKLQCAVGLGANRADLLECQFSRQHDLGQPHILQKACFLGRADIGLGTGMQLDGGQVDFQQPHVLDDERIYASVIQLPGQFAGGFQFIVTQNGVQGDEDAAVEAVCMAGQPRNVCHRVVGAGARPKRRAANVDRIRAMVHGFDANIRSASWCQQF